MQPFYSEFKLIEPTPNIYTVSTTPLHSCVPFLNHCMDLGGTS